MFQGRGLQKWAVVLVAIAVIGGIVGFVLTYNYYPRKHVNIQYKGECYELFGDAYESYNRLNAKRQIESLKLQLNAIKEPDAPVRIALSGSTKEASDFAYANDMQVLDTKRFEGIDKILVEGYIQKMKLASIVDDVSADTLLTDNILSNLAILPNQYISEDESKQIAMNLDIITAKGIEDMMQKNSGIKKAECR